MIIQVYYQERKLLNGFKEIYSELMKIINMAILT